MPHFTVSGTSVGARLGVVKDNILWAVTKVAIIGAVVVSVPPILAGVIVPGEGMTRTDTVISNTMQTHYFFWEKAGDGLKAVGSFMDSGN